jgi:hypothetical protein
MVSWLSDSQWAAKRVVDLADEQISAITQACYRFIYVTDSTAFSTVWELLKSFFRKPQINSS